MFYDSVTALVRLSRFPSGGCRFPCGCAATRRISVNPTPGVNLPKNHSHHNDEWWQNSRHHGTAWLGEGRSNARGGWEPVARSRERDLPFPGQLAATSATRNVNPSLGDRHGNWACSILHACPVPPAVTVPQVWLSTSDGHLPDCPGFAAVGNISHGSWHLDCRHRAVTENSWQGQSLSLVIKIC